MSATGVQKAAQYLNALGQQLPAIAQASETPGIDVGQFTQGLLKRLSVDPAETGVADLVKGFVALVQT